MKVYTHLTYEERVKMVLFYEDGLTITEIAEELERSRSTIYREIERNFDIETGKYAAKLAHRKYRCRITDSKGRIRDHAIRKYVIKKLKKDWSPERIAGRIRIDMPGKIICHETIYEFIYNQEPWLRKKLCRHHMKRHKKGQRKTHKESHIKNRVLIYKRSEAINTREEFGHWEDDAMQGLRSKFDGFTFFIERKSRMTKVKKLKRLESGNNHRNILNIARELPEGAIKSITYDNGKENAKHMKTNKKLNCVSYFCEDRKPYQKGSVENVIGIARRRYPKGTDLGKISPYKVKQLEKWLNNLPRKCHNWKTANEAFDELCRT